MATTTPDKETVNRMRCALALVTVIESTRAPRTEWIRALTPADSDSDETVTARNRLWGRLAEDVSRPGYNPSDNTRRLVLAHLKAAEQLDNRRTQL